jgi:L-fucose mutarotase
MLKSVDPILNADVLYALRAMGHGDDLVLCDMNFPADAIARQSVLGRLLRIDNVTAGRAARAILSVLPLDSFVDKASICRSALLSIGLTCRSSSLPVTAMCRRRCRP